MTEIDYDILVQDVLKYVLEKKTSGCDDSILDIVITYCMTQGVEPELVGDAIKDDPQFVNLIKTDIAYRENIINTSDW